jgi:serine/threonine-protein kinase
MARRFRSESKIARKVSHRNVCRIHEYGEDGRVSFISMEYVEGVNLSEHIDAHPLQTGEAFELALQIAAGLEAIHEHGIVHRDFKPANVMIDARGVAKIMDFGIAKLVASETAGTTGSIVFGTPEYMSPEQGTGDKVDVRSDVYSLGCVVYELFAGRPPFRGDTPLATLYLHQKEPPPLENPLLPAALVPVLATALAKEPKRRFASVAELAEALGRAREAWAGGPVPDPARAAQRPRETTAFSPAERRARRRRLVVVGWTGTALLAAGSLGLALRFGGGPTPKAPTPPVEGALEPATPAPDPSPTPRRESGVDDPPLGSPAPAPNGAPPASPTPVQPDPSLPGEAASEEPAVAGESGQLTVLVIPASEIEVDGRSLGTATQRELHLPPGPHAVRILHPDYQPLLRKVHVRAGVASTLVLDLAEKAIRKSP